MQLSRCRPIQSPLSKKEKKAKATNYLGPDISRCVYAHCRALPSRPSLSRACTQSRSWTFRPFSRSSRQVPNLFRPSVVIITLPDAGVPPGALEPFPPPGVPREGVFAPLPRPTFIQSYVLPCFFLPNRLPLPPRPANSVLVRFWLAWLLASAAFAAMDFLVSFFGFALSGSGATDPGVPGATLPAREPGAGSVMPSLRFCRFRRRASSHSRSCFAISRMVDIRYEETFGSFFGGCAGAGRSASSAEPEWQG